MVDGEVQQTFAHSLVLLAVPRIEDLLELAVDQVHVRRATGALHARRLDHIGTRSGCRCLLPPLQHHVPLDLGHPLAVGDALDAELPEIHDVARQCACFVRKHVLHLTHLLVEVGRSRSTVHVHVFHVVVGIKKYHLNKLHHAHGHQQRNGDEVCEEYEHPEEADDEDKNRAIGVAVWLCSQVEVRLVQVAGVSFTPCVDAGRDQAEDHLDHADAQCELPNLHLNMRVLAPLLVLAVHHDLCLPASVNDDANRPRHVLDLAAPQEDVLLVERYGLLLLAQLGGQCPYKGVEVLVGCLALHGATEAGCNSSGPIEIMLVTQEGKNSRCGLLGLQVGLAIEVRRLDVHMAICVRAANDGNVRGNVLVRPHYYHVAHLDVGPLGFHVWHAHVAGSRLAVCHDQRCSVVLLSV
mmetsp:Transcript_46079/g.139761  ORF Transcript_46079/g.139761 Transcript_46079/m.139761 type:complete len:409 (+) Transcript_46079:2046-3272(+)